MRWLGLIFGVLVWMAALAIAAEHGRSQIVNAPRPGVITIALVDISDSSYQILTGVGGTRVDVSDAGRASRAD